MTTDGVERGNSPVRGWSAGGAERADARMVGTLAALTAGALALSVPPYSRNDDFMDCGGAYVCGILTLETGLGPGAYRHDFVSVHGLWPETGSYGTSACIKPSSSSADPSKVYTCYDHPGGSGMSPLDFETHEWEKHGTCAGVKDADDFFSQLCKISAAPLEVMDAAKKAGHVDLNGYKSRLESAGYEVFSTDAENMQLQLSACAGSDGTWKLVAVADFGHECPAGSGPTPQPHGPPQQCARGAHGPPCSSDSDCAFPGCVRCAHSGFCTETALDGEDAE